MLITANDRCALIDPVVVDTMSCEENIGVGPDIQQLAWNYKDQYFQEKHWELEDAWKNSEVIFVVEENRYCVI